jgi:hypothetical protein
VETFGIFIAPLQLRHFVRTPTPKYSREPPADVLKPKRKTTANPEDTPQLVFETPTLQTETEQPQIPIKTPAKPKNSKTRKTGSN